MDLDLEHGVLAGQVLGVLLGEGDLDLALLTGRKADQLVLKARDEGAGAYLKRVIIGEGDAVHKALKVKDYAVALLHGAVNIDEAGVALARVGQGRLDFLIRDLGLGVHALQALILAQRDLRVELGAEGDGEDLRVVNVEVNDGGHTHGVKLLLAHGVLESLGGEALHGVLIEDVGAEHTLYNHARGLALAEAGDVYAALELLIRAVYGLVKALGVDLDLEHGGVVFFLFYILDDHGVRFLLRIYR